jgi:hypothetical protein
MSILPAEQADLLQQQDASRALDKAAASVIGALT